MKALIFLPLLLAACANNAKADLTASCDLVSTESLSSVAEADWPEGLSSAMDAYAAIDGSWSVDVSCDGAESSSATIQFTCADVSQVEIREFEGESCDEETWVALSDTTVTLSDWSDGAVDTALETRLGGPDYVRIDGGDDPSVLIQVTQAGEMTGVITFETRTEGDGVVEEETVECVLENWQPL